MKKWVLVAIICITATLATAQYTTELVELPRYEIQKYGNEIYCIDTTKGDLWWFDTAELKWVSIGSPKGAPTRNKGVYELVFVDKESLMVFDSDSADTWWTNGKGWTRIKEPK